MLKDVSWLINFVKTESFPNQSKTEYNKLVKVQKLIDDAEKAVLRFDNIMEDSSIVSIRNIRKADNNVNRAIKVYSTPLVDVTTNEKINQFIEDYEKKAKQKIKKYQELLDRITSIYKKLPADKLIMESVLGVIGTLIYDVTAEATRLIKDPKETDIKTAVVETFGNKAQIVIRWFFTLTGISFEFMLPKINISFVNISCSFLFLFNSS